MPNRHRRLESTANPLKMRRSLILYLTREQAVMITTLCRRHNLVDENGAARGVEAVRLLLVLGLTPTGASPARAAVAARINGKMMVASIGIRMSAAMGATTASRETPMFVPSRVNLRLEMWLHTQLSRFIPAYRDGHGKAQDSRIVSDFLARGLADHSLHEVTAIYASWINPLRVSVLRYERGVVDAFGKLGRQWAASTGFGAAANGG